jgi:hypothetical protein
MTVTLRDRSEIALRFLGPEEQRRVQRALEQLRTADVGQLQSASQLHRLKGSGSGLFALRVTPRLRAILSRQGPDWVVEDIVSQSLVRHL